MTEFPVTPEKAYSFPIRRPVATAMLFLTMVVFGWNSYQQLSINLMPEITYPTLTVRTEFEGAAPEDVEQLLTRPLEETLSTVSGMVQISSVSSPGLSEVILEFTWDSDINLAQQDVRDRLDLFNPPNEVTDRPVILRYDPTLDPVMRVAIIGNDYNHITDPVERHRRLQEELTVIREIAERHIKSDLEGELGIAQVHVKGGREEEIQVLVDSERLKNIGLTMANVVSALSQQNINLSGGSLREGRTEYLVRTLNEYETVEQIRETIIPNPARLPIRLEDVAHVALGQRDQESLIRINGREAVELAIYKWGDANTVDVANKLKDLLGFDRDPTFAERVTSSLQRLSPGAMPGGAQGSDAYQDELARTIQGRLPAFAQLEMISDQSAFILAAIREVQSTAIMGGALALIILLFFLRKLSSTFIIGVAIPISIVATFLPMFMRDISLNIMSLGGLALGIGMLVDNSIIVLESIFRCTEEGDSLVDAADRGTREVRSACTSSTFTTIAVFLPIAFVEGIAGQLFGDLALTVTFSLLISLVVALYLIPMLAARQPHALQPGENRFWMLRAYHTARESGAGPAGALARIPWHFLRYAGGWFADNSRPVLGPALTSLRRCLKGSDGPIRQGLALLALPLVLIQLLLLLGLFLVQTVLKSFLVFFVTGFFLITLVFATVVWALGAILSVLMWTPLRIFDLVFYGIRDGYTVFLRRILPLGPAVLLVVAGFAVHTLYLTGELGRELIPPMKQGEFGIRMEAPPGTRLETTAEQAEIIERLAMAMPEIETVAVEVGEERGRGDDDKGENIAQFTIRLRDPEVNVEFQDAIIDRLRQQVVRESRNDVAFTLPTLFSFRTAVEVQIRGEELDELKDIGRRALAAIGDIPGLYDAELTLREGYPEIIIELDRDLLASKNLSPEQVAQKLRTEVQGETATRFNQEGNKIDIRVRTDRERMQSLRDLRAMSVSEGYPPVPLSAVATLTVMDGPSQIRRMDQRRTAVITANVSGRDLGAVSDEIERRLVDVERPRDYQFILGGQNRELRTAYQSLQFALLLALFLVYVVMACQFESLHQPALVMFSVPLAFVGVIYMLYWLGLSLSIVVFIGGIVLAGVVVNDAIILVDYINQLRARGMAKRDAVVHAGRIRFRPIIMTTLTTVLGLIPMAVHSGEGAEVRQPMAITIIAGLTSGTILTLFIIPMVYDVLGGRDKA